MDRVYLCHTCQLSFTRKHQLRRHTRLHKNNDRVGCEHCGDKFKRSDLLSTHIEEMHSDIRVKPQVANNRKSSTANNGKPLHPHNSAPNPQTTRINPNPLGLSLCGPDPDSIDEWLDCFWPGYIGSMLKPILKEEETSKTDAPYTNVHVHSNVVLDNLSGLVVVKPTPRS